MPDRLEDALAMLEHQPTITVESFRDQVFTGVIERIYPEPRTLQGVVTYLVDVVIVSENRSILLPPQVVKADGEKCPPGWTRYPTGNKISGTDA